MVSSYQGSNGTLRKNIDIDWPSYTFSHSALYSTPEDLTAFMTALVAGKFVSKKTLNAFWKPMKLTNGQIGYYAFGFEYAERDGYIQVGHDGGNRVKLRHYYNADGSGDNYTLAYLTNGYTHGVWTDIFADSIMALVDSLQFQLARITELFMAEMLDNGAISTDVLYQNISETLEGETTGIEQFITSRSYAVRYAAGLEASLPAFEFLTRTFPNSANAWSNHAEQLQTLGNKKKAVEYYKIVLALNPEHKYAKQQMEQLNK
jgi:tetratricopeptide (TPR) repeat protein